MRAPALTSRLGPTAALVLALLAVPTSAGAAPQGADTSLEAATARATALSQELERATAQDAGYRVALERLEEQHRTAQSRLDHRVRAVWTSRRPEPLGGLPARLEAAGLRRLTTRGAAAAVRVDRELLDDVAGRSAQTGALRASALRARAGLGDRVSAALRAQEQARVLLADEQARLASQRLAGQRLAGQRLASARLASQRLAGARLDALRAALDAASAVVTTALAPVQTARGRRAQQAEGPVLALVEAAGAGYPAGYVPTGQVLAGVASWYGPGFVGSPTASGAPYDPERLTCAHKSLPLGTVVRVTANGRAVSCLVDDRGPYVGARILDMSRAGSRALGYDGVAQVVVEVLARG